MNSSTSSTITAKISRRSSPKRPVEAAEPLGERVEDEHRGDRAVDRRHAAEDAPDHDLERKRDLQRRRTGDAQVVREQRAGEARGRARDGEHRELVARRVDARGARGDLVVADRVQHDAEPRIGEQPQAEDDREHRHRGDVVVGDRRRARGAAARRRRARRRRNRERRTAARARSAERRASRATGTSRAGAGTDSPTSKPNERRDRGARPDASARARRRA